MQVPYADPLTGAERLRSTLPLVGRDIELQVIELLLATVAHDLPTGARALTISGEMGLGKTRLLAALCEQAKAQGFLVLTAGAYEAASTIPYFPFIEALRPLLHSAAPEALRRYLVPHSAMDGEQGITDGTLVLSGAPLIAALTRFFPELTTLLHSKQLASEQLPTTFQPEPLAPEHEKFRLFDALATLLEGVAAQQPVVLAIDNLQWADSASLELTLYLTVRLHNSRVALVGVTRPQRMRSDLQQGDEAVEANAATMAATRMIFDLVQQGMLFLLPLAPLSSEAAAAHLRSLLPTTMPPPALAQDLLDRAEGNPFFLEELVRQLMRHEHTKQVARASSVKLPSNIVLAVQDRLQGLSEPLRDLLQIASLFGRSFPVDALMQVVQKGTPPQGNHPHPPQGNHKGLPLQWNEGTSRAEPPSIVGAIPCGCPTADQVQALLEEALAATIIAEQAADGLDNPQSGDLEADDEPLLPLQQYLFCQGIVQEVLHDGIPSYRARSLHKAIGEALETCYGFEARQHAAELARHYVLSGEREATLRWSLLAGEDAVQQLALREAISHFRLVLKLLANGPAPTTLNVPSITELHLTIGELWSMLGELGQASQAFQQALQALQRTPDAEPVLLARANRLQADAYRMQTQYDLAIAHLQAAQSLLDSTPSSTTTPSSVAAQFIAPGWSGRRLANTTAEIQTMNLAKSERIALFQSQALLHIILMHPKEEAETALRTLHQLATETGDRSNQALALHLLGYLCGWGERVQEAIRLRKQANELYIALGHPFYSASGEQGLGIIYLALGEVEQARFYTKRGLDRAKRYGVRRMLGLLLWNQGIMALSQGAWEESKQLLQQALQEAETNNDMRLKPLSLQALAQLHFRQGDWQKAEQYFEDCIQVASTNEWFPGSLALYGHFLAVTGRHAIARTRLDRAAELPEPPGIASDYYLPFLAEGYLHLDLVERASTYIERIRNLHGFMYYGNAVDRILGVVAARIGDWETAQHAFEEGLLLCRRSGNAPEEAYILYEQARTAVMRNAPLVSLHTLCERARALFQRYEMQRAIAMVDQLRNGAEQLKPEQPLEHLTKRELEVLRLVAEGHTDREVADILVISPRTVNRHLSNIFVKLDMPGRAAAVAYAIRKRLV